MKYELRLGIYNYLTDEYDPSYFETVSTFEDVDIGRFRCTQCGTIGYYTGRWKEYWENQE